MCYYFLVHQWKKQIHGNSSWEQQKWYLQLTWRWKPDTRWPYAVRIADSEGNGTDYVYNLDIAQYVFSLPKWKIWKIIYLKQLPLRYRCDTVAVLYQLSCQANELVTLWIRNIPDVEEYKKIWRHDWSSQIYTQSDQSQVGFISHPAYGWPVWHLNLTNQDLAGGKKFNALTSM